MHFGFFLLPLVLTSCSTFHQTTSRGSASLQEGRVSRPITHDYLKEMSSYHFLMSEMAALEQSRELAKKFLKTARLYDSQTSYLKQQEIKQLLDDKQIFAALDKAEKEIDSQSVEGALFLGDVYIQIGMHKEAIKIYLQVEHKITDTEQRANLYTLLTFSYLQIDQFHSAIKYAKKSVNTAQGMEKEFAIYHWGVALIEQGKIAEAIKVYDKYLNSSLNITGLVLSALANIYKAQSKTNMEIAILKKHRNNLLKQGIISKKLFLLYFQKNKLEQALQETVTMDREDIQSLGTQFRIGLIFFKLQNYSEAATKLQKLAVQYPDLDKVQFYLGLSYKKLQKLQKALHYFAQIDKQSSFYFDAASLQVEINNKNQNFKKSHQLIDKNLATILTPERQLNLQYMKVLTYHHESKEDEAIQLAKNILKKDGQFVEALNYIAFLLAERKENLDEAKRLATRAHKLKPNDAYIMDTVGWVLFQQRQYKEAQSYLTMAYKISGDYKIAEHLGDLYLEMNKPHLATKMYMLAMKALSASSTIKKAKEKNILQKKLATVQHKTKRRLSSEQTSNAP